MTKWITVTVKLLIDIYLTEIPHTYALPTYFLIIARITIDVRPRIHNESVTLYRDWKRNLTHLTKDTVLWLWLSASRYSWTLTELQGQLGADRGNLGQSRLGPSQVLRAATCKYHLQLCKIEKSKIPKLCHNKGFRYLITEILVSIHSLNFFSFAATFPSRTFQWQANRLKIPLLFAHCLEIKK